jgi:hypothetical protein
MSTKKSFMRRKTIQTISKVTDKNYPDLHDVTVKDIVFDGYEFGGGLIIYMSIDKVNVYINKVRTELPKIHIAQFDIDPLDMEVALDLYDEVEIHYRNKTVPGIPNKDDEMIWGGIRCQKRWCNRFSLCQGHVPPQTEELSKIL